MTGLDVYGLRASLTGDWPEVIDQLLLDYAWFRRELEGPAEVEVEVQRRPPDFGAFGELDASFVTPRNVVYEHGALTVIDYFGRALSVLDRDRGRLTLQGEDEHLVHEAGYQFLLSQDRRAPRPHRAPAPARAGPVHARRGGRGDAPLGRRQVHAGAARAPGRRRQLLSEDSPLMDRHGRLHPFPLRIGVNEASAQDLPAEKLRRLERMEFHPKLALEVEAFAERIRPEPQQLAHIVVGRRSLGTSARLDTAPPASGSGHAAARGRGGRRPVPGNGVRAPARRGGHAAPGAARGGARRPAARRRCAARGCGG